MQRLDSFLLLACMCNGFFTISAIILEVLSPNQRGVLHDMTYISIVVNLLVVSVVCITVCLAAVFVFAWVMHDARVQRYLTVKITLDAIRVKWPCKVLHRSGFVHCHSGCHLVQTDVFVSPPVMIVCSPGSCFRPLGELESQCEE